MKNRKLKITEMGRMNVEEFRIMWVACSALLMPSVSKPSTFVVSPHNHRIPKFTRPPLEPRTPLPGNTSPLPSKPSHP